MKRDQMNKRKPSTNMRTSTKKKKDNKSVSKKFSKMRKKTNAKCLQKTIVRL